MTSDELGRRGVAKPPVLKLGSRLVVLHPGASTKVSNREVDVCFVFDTTGSMSDKIDGLVRSMDLLVAELGRLALDWRVTTVPFGDLTVVGDRIIVDLGFVSTVEAASTQLRTLPRFSGGGNLGESSVEAMLAATRKDYRSSAVKVLVLITDEPALGSLQEYLMVDQALSRIDAVCFTVSPRLDYYKEWAMKHGGEWREIGAVVDTSGILELFKSLLARVAAVADSVHRLGGGSVRAYLDRGGGGNS